jgi:hypothetical protein
MSEDEVKQPLIGIFDKVDGAILKPIDSKLVNLSSTTPETESLIKSNSLSFPATDLLNLSSDNLSLLSRRVRSLFTNIASKNKIKCDKKDLEQFKDGDTNSLIHEVEHLKRIKEIRPELIEGSSVNILAILHQGQLKLGMNVIVPTPDVEYTAVEKTAIQVAPNLPSDPDYFNLMLYLKGHPFPIEDIEKIKEMITQKRQSSGKNHFLAFLSSL